MNNAYRNGPLPQLTRSLVRTAKALAEAEPDSRHFEWLREERNALIQKLRKTWNVPPVNLAILADLPWESVYDILDGQGDPRS